MRRRALRFPDHSLQLKALALLAELEATGPVEYQPVGEDAALLPEWVYARLVPLLREHDLPFSEVPVVPMSDLPPLQQAKLRGLKPGRGSRRRGLAH